MSTALKKFKLDYDTLFIWNFDKMSFDQGISHMQLFELLLYFNAN